MKRNLFFLTLALLSFTHSSAQFREDSPVMIGAEILIEPGQTPEEVDLWFRTLRDNGFTITRLRMFEDYMTDADGNRDFSLFDQAFEAGDKYGIKILGNLFPSTSFDDIGGFKFPRDRKHWEDIKEYIKEIVTHFRDYESLFGWVPVNEPGLPLPWHQEFTQERFREWRADAPLPVETDGVRHFPFDREKFTLYYHPWFMSEMTREIRKYDTKHPIHLNPSAVLDFADIYEFSLWRDFLTSLGGSAHAAWHFGQFDRSRYATAMSATSEFLRSGAQGLPWFMTEIQGGNNTYSGGEPMCPTPDEISQWLWIVIGSGSKGGMFWCLNPRRSGVEAGEWAMLDFQNAPSDRFEAAAGVAKAVNDNNALFANARAADSGVSVLYVKEAVWVEEKLTSYINDHKYEARRKGGVMKSALGFFETLSQCGFNPAFGDINDYDFDREAFDGRTIVLSHQIAIPSRYRAKLEHFVREGGTLIVEGMTACYDEHAVCVMYGDFPFGELFGGEPTEFKFSDGLFDTKFFDRQTKAHLWEGFIKPVTGEPIGNTKGGVTGIRNYFGKGKVIWIPSLISMGARLSGDYRQLAGMLADELPVGDKFRFREFQPGVLMKNLYSDDSVISVIVSQHSGTRRVELSGFDGYEVVKVLYNNKNGRVKRRTITIRPQETIAIVWRKIQS